MYKYTWTPQINQVLQCEEDTRVEAKEYDANAIGVYVIKPDANKTLAGHVPIELSHLLRLLPTSKRQKSAGRTSNGEEKEGSWARCTGKIHSLHTRTEKCQNFGERTKWTSVKI